MVINVQENNKILNNVNVKNLDLAQPVPKPRSIFNRNAVINGQEHKKRMDKFDEFELDELIELEPDVDY